MPRTYSEIYLHLIFATKGRNPYLSEGVETPLYSELGGIVRRQGGTALAIGGMPDHLHLLVRWRPSRSVAQLMKNLKGSSSRWLNTQAGLDDPFAWQEGYAVFSVSRSQVPRVRSYIERQKVHHRKMSSLEELEILTRGE